MDVSKEEMDWEDYQGFPRSTRQPYKCSKCGMILRTREIWIKHTEMCMGPGHSKITAQDEERRRILEESLKNFKKEHHIK